MSELEEYAVPLSILRHGSGYSEDTQFVVLRIAQNRIDEYKKANRILIGENDKWAKELELTLNENIKLKTGHSP